jgi:hypothetical protein
MAATRDWPFPVYFRIYVANPIFTQNTKVFAYVFLYFLCNV